MTIPTSLQQSRSTMCYFLAIHITLAVNILYLAHTALLLLPQKANGNLSLHVLLHKIAQL